MPRTMQVHAASDYAAASARWIADLIDDAIDEHGSCSIALCGGSTPIPVLAALATLPVDWGQVVIFFGDERRVPPDSPDSNYAMAKAALLDLVEIDPANVFRMEGEAADPDAAARDYDAGLPEALDLLLLGIGPDGHTASLFPRSPALRELEARVVAVAAPAPPLQPAVGRLTITPPVIAAARTIAVLVTGASKAAIVAQILDGPQHPLDLPAQLARRGMWILDDAAASHL
jgi:6-phosphogluconolactonase